MAVGAALLAGRATGLLPSGGGPGWAAASPAWTAHPDPAARQAYNDLYARWAG